MKVDYSKYEFTKGEKLRYLCIGLIISSVTALLCYKSLFGVCIMSPYSLFYLKKIRIKKRNERKWELNLQFRNCIQSISAALNAGYSIENAFSEALSEMKLLHSENSYICSELRWMIGQIELNHNIEDILMDFACRSGIEDIYVFSEVFGTAKRTGGDIIKVINLCTKNIGDKIEINREIITMVRSKQFEAGIMSFVPFGIILYLWLFSPGFLDVMYHNPIGICIMSVLLLLYYAAKMLMEKIVAIDI